MNDLDTCLRCHRDLRDYETRQYICGRCEDLASRALNEIPQLYSQLGQHLHRGAGGNGPAVSGSKAAPVPLRLAVLDMQTEKGPILAPLQGWVRDWETYGHGELAETGSLQDRIDGACRTLRYNLRWAVQHHPAVDEAVDEFLAAWRTLTRITTGETAPRRIAVTCPCQQTLRITLDTRGETCPRCGAEYGHAEALRLPLAERRAAA
ncbi:hypothetical protein ACFWFX_28765 [Streptomyces roseolus]|uniref:hypothetical protein n=1 Tax=Streptomyces roseolus TaxID=67358 RepID=UPI003659DB88